MKTRTLRPAAPSDRTPERLLNAGWKQVGDNPWLADWIDPRTGRRYAITQAEAIRQDRETPRYYWDRTRPRTASL